VGPRLDPLPEYIAARSTLSPQLVFELELVEEGIAVDPEHRQFRRDMEGRVYDYSALRWGLIVVYRLVGDRVELIELGVA
jgi:hypothetical protein